MRLAWPAGEARPGPRQCPGRPSRWELPSAPNSTPRFLSTGPGRGRCRYNGRLTSLKIRLPQPEVVRRHMILEGSWRVPSATLASCVSCPVAASSPLLVALADKRNEFVFGKSRRGCGSLLVLCRHPSGISTGTLLQHPTVSTAEHARSATQRNMLAVPLIVI